MTTIKNIFCLFAITLLLTIGLNSCCKLQIYETLEVKFENFNFSTMDSVLLIKADRNNIAQHQDTIFYNLTETHSIKIPVYDNDGENGSFIIKILSPPFEHFITEVNAERTKSFGCAGGNIKFSFKWNGTEYKKEKKHTITIKP
jgi:hypothetical protein